MTTTVPLADVLESIAQGLPTQRYEVEPGEGGESFRVVQTRQLDTLHVPANLPELHLKGERLERAMLTAGTVLVAIRTWPIKVGVVTLESAGALAGANLAVLSPRPEVDPVFLAGLLRSDFMTAHLGVRSAASGQPMLSLRQLQELRIPLPSLEGQQALAALFLEREEADRLARESTEQRRRVVEAALHKSLIT